MAITWSSSLLINVVAGGDPVELAGDGCWLSHDERYEAASEFLDVWKGVLSGQVVDLEGKHITVKGAQQLFPTVSQPHPPVYFGGSSPAAHDLAARHVDLYLSWGEPLDDVAKKSPTCASAPPPMAARCALACACT